MFSMHARPTRRLAAAIALVVLGVSGCGGPTPGDAAASAASASPAAEKKFAIIISSLDNPWFVALAEAAKKRSEQLGYGAVLFDSQNDTARETAHFENAIAGGYAAILFNATDSEGSVGNVRKAKEHGVPVFCIDREINATDLAASQILSDSYAGCVELGQLFVETVGEEGQYVEIVGVVGDNNTWNRSEGFHSVVDRYPGLKMVAQQAANCDRAQAFDVMESILQANPDIDAVFCTNDAMAMGAYQALLAAGRADAVKVFGFDGAPDVLELIAEGKIAATSMQFPKVMARMAAEFADEWLKGRRDFEKKISVAVETVTPENVSEYGDFGRLGE